MTAYRKIETRVNPGNKDIQGPALETAREVAVRELRDRILPMAIEAFTEDPDEQHPQLHARMLAHGLSEGAVSRMLTLRGIGWPLPDIVIDEGEYVTIYEFVDDPEVPLGQAVQGQPQIIEQSIGGNNV